jgi:hypothetical protein
VSLTSEEIQVTVSAGRTRLILPKKL